MLWCAQPFAKSSDTVELLSFDPGLVNAGVIHVRVDRRNGRICVLHAALINVCDPFQSLSLESNNNDDNDNNNSTRKRKRKPNHVEPYSYRWPQVDFAPVQSRAHAAKLAEAKQRAAQQELKFEHQVALMPFALQSAGWLDGSDPNLDYVLVEVQDPVNAKMRSVGHAVQTYYESLNARWAHQSALVAQREEAIDLVDPRQLRVHYVSSRLKLSDAVLSVLGDTLRFDSVAAAAAADTDLSSNLRAVISTRSHAAKKSSAVQVFKVLAEHAPDSHPFFVWLAKQRATKHNILDALLQTFSFLMQESIGFSDGLLNGTRKQLQRNKAKQKRDAVRTEQQQQQQQQQNGNEPGDSGSLGRTANALATQTQVPVPKRRRIERNVPVDFR